MGVQVCRCGPSLLCRLVCGRRLPAPLPPQGQGRVVGASPDEVGAECVVIEICCSPDSSFGRMSVAECKVFRIMGKDAFRTEGMRKVLRLVPPPKVHARTMGGDDATTRIARHWDVLCSLWKSFAETVILAVHTRRARTGAGMTEERVLMELRSVTHRRRARVMIPRGTCTLLRG